MNGKYVILRKTYDFTSREESFKNFRKYHRLIPDIEKDPLWDKISMHKPKMKVCSYWHYFNSNMEFSTFEEAFDKIKTLEKSVINQNVNLRYEYKIVFVKNKQDPDGLSRIDRAYLSLVQKKMDAGVLDKDDVCFLK